MRGKTAVAVAAALLVGSISSVQAQDQFQQDRNQTRHGLYLTIPFAGKKFRQRDEIRFGYRMSFGNRSFTSTPQYRQEYQNWRLDMVSLDFTGKRQAELKLYGMPFLRYDQKGLQFQAGGEEGGSNTLLLVGVGVLAVGALALAAGGGGEEDDPCGIYELLSFQWENCRANQ